MNNQIFLQEFPLREGLCYLNHAAVSPWPLRTSKAITDFAEENTSVGSLNYPQWMTVESDLKNKLARLINAGSSDEIALVKNTSEALSIVAYGVKWRPGENIIITDQEFPSNRIVWESLAQLGVELRVAEFSLENSPNPENNILKLCDNKTRLVAISSIQYASGLRAQLATIGEFCKTNQILFCVDAIQSVGAVQFDVQAIGADFAMADGHKWMLGPEGLAFFYCHPEARDKLHLNQYGWHMTEDYLNFDNKDWIIASNNRRFECGSPNMLGIHGLNASLSLLEEVGMPVVESLVLQKSQHIIDRIENACDYELITLPHIGRIGGIITFKHRSACADEVYDYLIRNDVMCAKRGGGIRISPHFYTPTEIIDNTLDLLMNVEF